MLGKVEICGVNTSRLQTLSNEEMMRLIELAQKGDQAAKQRLLGIAKLQQLAGRREVERALKHGLNAQRDDA